MDLSLSLENISNYPGVKALSESDKALLSECYNQLYNYIFKSELPKDIELFKLNMKFNILLANITVKYESSKKSYNSYLATALEEARVAASINSYYPNKLSVEAALYSDPYYSELSDQEARDRQVLQFVTGLYYLFTDYKKYYFNLFNNSSST